MEKAISDLLRAVVVKDWDEVAEIFGAIVHSHVTAIMWRFPACEAKEGQKAWMN